MSTNPASRILFRDAEVDELFSDEGKPLALVVDDEPLLCMLGEDQLRELGFAVCACDTASGALEVISNSPPLRLLLTDIRFPGAIDGWQLGALAREQMPGLCVLYVSGDSARRGELAPTERFLRKPYSLDDLKSVMASLSLPTA